MRASHLADGRLHTLLLETRAVASAHSWAAHQPDDAYVRLRRWAMSLVDQHPSLEALASLTPPLTPSHSYPGSECGDVLPSSSSLGLPSHLPFGSECGDALDAALEAPDAAAIAATAAASAVTSAVTSAPAASAAATAVGPSRDLSTTPPIITPPPTPPPIAAAAAPSAAPSAAPPAAPPAAPATAPLHPNKSVRFPAQVAESVALLPYELPQVPCGLPLAAR